MSHHTHKVLLTALVAGMGLLLALTAGASLAAGPAGHLTPTAFAYLPYAARSYITATPTRTATPRPPTSTPTQTPECPTSSTNTYSTGIAYQHDTDNPVRRAWNHADKNLHLRWFTPNSDPWLQRELVNYGSDDPTMPPQLATLFYPPRVPPLVNFYRVYDWIWRPSPDPGYRGNPLTTWPVTAMGLGTGPGEVLHVPKSGYDLGGGMEVLVLYADEDTLNLHYTREDSAAHGYTVHLQNICTDPNLLAAYRQTDADPGPRYIYPNPSYALVNLYGGDPTSQAPGQPIGWTRGNQTIIAIVDSGVFMDTRSCNEWWRFRPGYTGSCPPP